MSTVITKYITNPTWTIEIPIRDEHTGPIPISTDHTFPVSSQNPHNRKEHRKPQTEVDGGEKPGAQPENEGNPSQEETEGTCEKS